MTEQPSVSFAGILERAYRRACRTGMPEVGTDLVLSFAAVYVRLPEGRPLLPLPLPFTKVWRPVRRGKTGLSDPQPPSTEWETHFGEEVAFEAAAVLGQAVFRGTDVLRSKGKIVGTALPVFSPAVRYAVHDAIARAARQDADDEIQRAEPRHLVLAMLALHDSLAARLLKQWEWVSQQELQTALGDANHRAGASPADWAIVFLIYMGVLPAAHPRRRRGPGQVPVWLLGTFLRRRYRQHGARYGHPILFRIESEAPTKAAQAGHGTVTAAHVLIALIDLHEQLASADTTLADEVARWNQAGVILASHGVRLRPAARAAARLESVPSDAEHDLTDLPTRGWATPQASVGAPTQGRTALAALRHASLTAYRLGHPYAGTTHLLAALLEEPLGPAARLLRRLDVDPDAVRSEVTRRLDGATLSLPGGQG